MSSDLARDVLDRIRDAGVRTVCVCPGARNAEWVRLLSQPDCSFEVFWFPEERSASFFALGRIRSSGSPAVVVTTSGTAVGELLPAAMEAYYSGYPLILITADRPRRFRGSGAPQAAEQTAIFGVYAPTAFDLEGAELLSGPIPVENTPVHINVSFEDPNTQTLAEANTAQTPAAGNAKRVAEPHRFAPTDPTLADGNTAQTPAERNAKRVAEPHRFAADDTRANLLDELERIAHRDIQTSIAGEIEKLERPILIVGALEAHERDTVREFVNSLRAPAYLESLSGLRGVEQLSHCEIRVADKLFRRAHKAGYPPDGVIRIGGVPTHRLWRDLEDLDLPVLSISRLSFSGLGRESTHIQTDLWDLPERVRPIDTPDTLIQDDRAVYRCLKETLEQEPSSEPGLFRALSKSIPNQAFVFVGNSLPIREWDLAAAWDGRCEVAATRGLNGIDGQISTFLGMCRRGRSNWAILGDLTTIYDLAGPWPMAQLPKDLDANLVIVNNGGGKIFDRMFSEPAFQNRHNLSFEHWAAMWGLGYERVDTSAALAECAGRQNAGLRVIEAIPDPASTERFWTAYNGALA